MRPRMLAATVTRIVEQRSRRVGAGERPVRDGLIGILVEGARKDPGFPKQGDPKDVRSRLRALQVEGDIFEAVDDAETDWLSY